MKKLWILLLTLLLLCGCGKDAGELPESLPPSLAAEEQMTEPEPTAAETTETEFHLAYTSMDLPCGLGNATAQCVAEEKIITGGMAEDGAKLTWMTTDGQSGELEKPDGAEFFYALCAEEKGFTLLCGSCPGGYYDFRGDLVETEKPLGRLYLAFYDENGMLGKTVELSERYDSYVFKSLLPVEDGYLAQSYGLLVKLDRQGKELRRLEADETALETFWAAARAEDGVYLLSRQMDAGWLLWQLDWDSFQLSDRQALGERPVGMGLDRQNNLTLNRMETDGGLTSFAWETGEGEQVLSWQDLGACINKLLLFSLPEGFLFYEPYEDKMELVLPAPGPKPEPVLLTMADLDNSGLRELARDFNLSQTEYRVDCTAYGGYEEPAYELLQAEIMAGKGPDLFAFGDQPAEAGPQYGGMAPSDLCTDLSEMLRERLLPSLYGAMEKQDERYAAPLAFQAVTTVAPKTLIPEPGVSLEELEAVRQQAGEEWKPFISRMTADWLFSETMPFYVGKYVDWEEASCSFDSPAFVDYLTWCKTWAGDGSQGDPDQRVILKMYTAHDMGLAIAAPADSPYSLKNYTYAGFPVESGYGSYFHIVASVGVSKQSENQEGALAFVRYCLDHCIQAQAYLDGIPATQAAFDAVTERCKAGDGVSFFGDPLTFDPEDAAKFNALLEQTTVLDNRNETIKSILTDEAEYYFAGAKTAEETAEIIQDRVSLYLMEQYG